MTYIVKSPVEGFNGLSAGVQFTGGVGKTSNENAADWLKSHGYQVTEEKPKAEKPEESKTKEPEKPKAEGGGKAKASDAGAEGKSKGGKT